MSGAQVIRYSGVATRLGQSVDLVVSAVGAYNSIRARTNNGCNGQFGSIHTN